MDDLPRSKDGIANITYLRDAARLKLLDIGIVQGQRHQTRKELEETLKEVKVKEIKDTMLVMKANFLINDELLHEAQKILKKIKKRKKTKPETKAYALMLLASTHTRKSPTKKDIEQATEYLKQALEQDIGIKTKCQAYRILALTLLKEGKYDDAITSAQEDITLSEKCGMPLETARAKAVIAKAHKSQKKYEQAKQEYTQAATDLLELGAIDDYLDAIYGSIRCTIEQRNIEKAITEYEQAIKDAKHHIPRGQTTLVKTIIKEYAKLILRIDPEKATELLEQGLKYLSEMKQENSPLAKRYESLIRYVEKQQTKQ